MKKCVFFMLAFLVSTISKGVTNGNPDYHPRLGTLRTLNSVYCKGLLIEPRLVITAAHCGIDLSERNEFVMVDSLGNYSGYQIIHFEIPRNYSQSKSLYGDIALVVLRDPVLAEPEFEKIELATAIPKSGDLGQVFGGLHELGVDDDTLGKDDNKFKITSATLVVEKMGAVLEDHMSLEDPRSSGLPAKTCFGDSGGPFITKQNGVEYLAGIVSYNRRSGWELFWNGKKISRIESCQKGQTQFTSVAYHSQWLSETRARLRQQYGL